MEFNQLLSFYQIIRTGSFTRASEKVLRTQSALSHQIRNLEAELNVNLFDRSGHNLKLTWEGEVLLEVISKFLVDIDNLKRIYADAREGKRGTLTIATSSAIMTYCMGDVITRLNVHAPHIKFKFIASTNVREIHRILLDGAADVGIGARLSTEMSDKLDFVYWRSFSKMLLAKKGHPLARRKDLGLVDVAQYPLILYREGTQLRRDVEEAFKRHGLRYDVIIESDVADTIKKYVGMGLGIAILSSLAITESDRKVLLLRNVDHLLKQMDYGIYYRKGTFITTPMREFIRLFAPDLLHVEASGRPVATTARGPASESSRSDDVALPPIPKKEEA